MTSRLLLLGLFAAAPLAAQQTGSAAEVVKQMTPEERAQAQRKLNAAAAVFYDGPIDSAKSNLRSVLKVMRDSMLAVEGEAARLQRAASPAVRTATARRLRNACLAAARTASVTQLKVAPYRTSAELGDKVLADFRVTLTETGKVMTDCDRSLGTALTGTGDLAAKVRPVALTVSAAAVRYETSADGVLRTLGIPLRPRGMPGGL
jgi:hypothetical protein